MIRFYYVILKNTFRLPGIIKKMARLAVDESKSENERYKYLRHVVDLMQTKGKIRTEVYGAENLPKEGGYVMYPNHQGKYDAYGIVSAHQLPCTVVMDRDKSYEPFIREVIDMMEGKRLDKQDVRQGFMVMKEITEEVSAGRHYIIFPEGGYDKEKKNSLGEFKAGCFKTSIKSKTPIVPVTLIDTYKAFNSCSLRKVTTQVHFLKPIPYEEYEGMKTPQIAEMVKERIQAKIDEIIGRMNE